MKKPQPSPAELFWIGLASYILIADMYLWRNRKDTMSIQFGKWLETKHGKMACVAITATLVSHLFIRPPLLLQIKIRNYLGGIK